MMNFFRSVFSETPADGGPSFSRVASGAALAAVLVWVSRLVWKTNAIPDLTGCVFLICALYGINKASGLISELKSK